MEEGERMPFAWDTARYCLDHYGNVLHFPAGSYDKQVGSWLGRKQMDAMQFVNYARHVFKQGLHKTKPGSYEAQLYIWAYEYKRSRQP